MKLVCIYGLPATGKLTVARELAAITGFKLFHNHLVVDLLLSIFEFGSPPFTELREDIWLSVFDRAYRTRTSGLIFTFTPEATVRPGFIDRMLRTVAGAGGEVHFVELLCPVEELKHRMENPSRLQFQKLSSVSQFEQLHAAGTFEQSYMPAPRLSIATSLCTPRQAAIQIKESLESRLRHHPYDSPVRQ